MIKLGVLVFWIIFSGGSVNALDKCLRTFIEDYEVKRPRILMAVVIGMIWIALSVGVLAVVF